MASRGERIMSNTQTFTIKKTFQVPATTIFNAWVQPDQMIKWFGPPGFYCKQVEMEVNVGRSFHIHMVGPKPEETSFHIRGTYHEIVENQRLVFSWRWDGPIRDETQSQVEILFNEKGRETELILNHYYLPNEEEVQGHKAGWSGSLTCLEEMIKEQLS